MKIVIDGFIMPCMYFGAYFLRWTATREINTKITHSWAHKPLASRVFLLFYIYAVDRVSTILFACTSFMHIGIYMMKHHFVIPYFDDKLQENTLSCSTRLSRMYHEYIHIQTWL